MIRDYRSRGDRLRDNISDELKEDKPSLTNIIKAVNVFESDNIDTISKLMRKKKATMNRINGAIRQSIDAHGPINKILIGSVGKRVYGAILDLEKEEKRKVSIRDIAIGVTIATIIFLFFI